MDMAMIAVRHASDMSDVDLIDFTHAPVLLYMCF